MRGIGVRAVVGAVVALLAVGASAAAQDYPSKPIRIVVPLAAGGISDVLARPLAQKLGEKIKQPVIVDNRPGANGALGAEIAAKSAPDGYTYFVGFHGSQVILPALGAQLPYDPEKDFAPVILMGSVANVLLVPGGSPARSVKDLVAMAKAKPNTISYASQGVGSSGHITAAQFQQIAGVDIVHVPYKGGAPAVQDLLGGHVAMLFDALPSTIAHVREGTLRALAICAAERLPLVPDVPTMAEAGYPGIEAGAWFALFAPAQTPRPIIEWMNREAAAILGAPEQRERFAERGIVVPLGSPEALAAHVAAEKAKWTRVIRTAGIRLEQ